MKERILIVDDEDTIRFVLQSLVSGMGHETVVAGSAEEGLARLTEAPVSVALIDIILPGINGIELLRRIKQASPDTEVMVMTSHSSLETAIEALRHGAYDYLSKPFELDDVSSALTRALERRSLTLRNRQLLAEQEARNRELAALVKRLGSLNVAGQTMSGMRTLSELFDCLLDLVTEELASDRASIMLLEEEPGELYIAAARGFDAEVAKTVRLKLGEGIAGQVAATGQALLIKDAQSDPRMPKPADSRLGQTLVSTPILLSVPIKGPGKVLGVLNISQRRSGIPFDEEDLAYLSGLAGQAAVAIERARHSDQLREALQSLQATQEQLVASARIGALGKMAAGVAHDFNNILNGILGRTQILLGSLGHPPADLDKALDGLHTLEALALQGAEAVRRLQEFSRIRRDRPEESTDLVAAAKQAVELTKPKWQDEQAAAGRQIFVELELAPVPRVPGNLNEVCQAISNLIFNAVEAMPEGGLLTLRSFTEGEMVCLEVIDAGIGMNVETKARLFEPFFTTKPKGQGLGTSVVYGIVARLGGTIQVDSEIGQGTAITLKLPRDDSSPVPPARKPGEARAPELPCRVLVVDDQEENLHFYRDALESSGLEVQIASSGADGIAALEQRPFDVVVTDLGMPGMSGWDVSKAVKVKRPGTPVVLLSGWAVQQDQAELAGAGVDLVLAKPITIPDLLRGLSEVVKKRKTRSKGEAQSRTPPQTQPA